MKTIFLTGLFLLCAFYVKSQAFHRDTNVVWELHEYDFQNHKGVDSLGRIIYGFPKNISRIIDRFLDSAKVLDENFEHNKYFMYYKYNPFEDSYSENNCKCEYGGIIEMHRHHWGPERVNRSSFKELYDVSNRYYQYEDLLIPILFTTDAPFLPSTIPPCFTIRFSYRYDIIEWRYNIYIRE